MGGKKTVIAVLAAVAVIAILSVPKKRSIDILDVFGTVSQITVYDRSDKALDECRDFLYRADKLLSYSDSESEIYRLNCHEAVELSPETEELLRLGEGYSDQNTFNIFCGALTDRWEQAKADGGEYLPDTDAISSVYPFSLVIKDHMALLANPEQKVNLGAIAKGYATKKLVEILDNHSVKRAIINLGGNIYVKGRKSGRENWKVGIQDPDGDGYLGVLSLSDTAVITSGDYERYFERNGVRYHHIIDPKTGISAKSGLRAVTVICADPTVGDMLSTKCFIAGFEKSHEFLSEYVALAIFVTDGRKVYYPKEISDRFDKRSEKYIFLEY